MPKTIKKIKNKRKNKTRKNKGIKISSNFESGNIVNLESTTNNDVHLEILERNMKKNKQINIEFGFILKQKM